MLEYILRLLILLPLVGGMAWGSLWLWKRVQMGAGLPGSAKQGRAIEMVGVLPLGPGTKLAVVEFAGQQILLSVSRGQVTRLADNSQGDFHVG
jgi:flagellar protein FliO/FliZ